MADVDPIPQEKVEHTDNAKRDGGAAWSAGLGLVRSDATDTFKVAVNSTLDGPIAGWIPKGFEAQPDGGLASMVTHGRIEVPITDGVTTTMGAPLSNDAAGKHKLADGIGDVIVAIALQVVTGNGQRAMAELVPEGSQLLAL